MVYEGCSRLTSSVIARINKRRGIGSLGRYIAQLHFTLGSRDGTRASCLGGQSNIIAIISSNNRCRIIVKGRITSICSTVLHIASVTEIQQEKRTSKRGKASKVGLFSHFISVISKVFRPILNILYTTKVLGNLATIAIIFNLSRGSKLCLVLGATNSKVFRCLPLFLTVATTHRFGLSSFAKLTLKYTVICPALTADVGSSAGFLKVPIVLPTNKCCRAIIPVVFTM